MWTCEVSDRFVQHIHSDGRKTIKRAYHTTTLDETKSLSKQDITLKNFEEPNTCSWCTEPLVQYSLGQGFCLSCLRKFAELHSFFL